MSSNFKFKQGAIALACIGGLLSVSAHASVDKTIEPKEISYTTTSWQGVDSLTGYQYVLDVDSQLSVGVLKGDPYFYCSGTWRLIEITIPEADAKLAGVDSKLDVNALPHTTLAGIKLNNIRAQFALDKNGNFALDCDLGKFAPSASEQVSDSMPMIPAWGNLIVNGIDKQFVNQTLAKDVIYSFVSTFRKDATAKIAQHAPEVVSAKVDFSALQSWLAEMAHQNIQPDSALLQSQAKQQKLAYVENSGFDDNNFDLFVQSLYERKRINEATTRISQQFDKQLAATSALLKNHTCVSSQELSSLSGNWSSGTAMFERVQQCHQKKPDFGFVRTDKCAGLDSNVEDSQNVSALSPDAIEMQTGSIYCAAPLMQFVSLKNGAAVSDADYLDTSGFSREGLAAVQLHDSRWQVVTSAFNTIKALADVADFKGGFHNQRIIFRNKRGLYGAMDSKFNVVVPAKFEEMQSFSSAITRVKYQGRYGVINKQGNWIVPARYEEAGYVENGHIIMRETKQESPWLLINKEGTLIKETQSEGNSRPSVQALLK
ncbi:WG repeat-containing protein [Thalassotalea mangrovi]|uniref:WG repeat-containing protein n=1 Tax=Thalassotalea mangrovi TaxID=2572245 RepID=A0A4U1B463_9GAMM|nr:WG repeat-containing protein [Thalassotalea mangrovi]TKB44871.1 WG repeat-containing protein [Thalassotalea mangrovi]